MTLCGRDRPVRTISLCWTPASRIGLCPDAGRGFLGVQVGQGRIGPGRQVRHAGLAVGRAVPSALLAAAGRVVLAHAA